MKSLLLKNLVKLNHILNKTLKTILVMKFCRTMLNLVLMTVEFNGELTDCKDKLLKFTEKENQWKRDMSLVVESEKTLKDKYDEL